MATFERSVTTDWEGGLMDGNGVAKAGSGAFSLPVTFPEPHRRARGQDEPGGADGGRARRVLRDGDERARWARRAARRPRRT